MSDLESGLSRKEFLRGAASALFASLALSGQGQTQPKAQGLVLADLEVIQRLIGTSFSQSELKEILSDIQQQADAAADLRATPLTNSEPMASLFTVLTPVPKESIKLKSDQVRKKTSPFCRSVNWEP